MGKIVDQTKTMNNPATGSKIVGVPTKAKERFSNRPTEYATLTEESFDAFMAEFQLLKDAMNGRRTTANWMMDHKGWNEKTA